MAIPKPIGIKRRKGEAIFHNYMKLGHIAFVEYVPIWQVQMIHLRILGPMRFPVYFTGVHDVSGSYERILRAREIVCSPRFF
jgi:hypothetical protein